MTNTTHSQDALGTAAQSGSEHSRDEDCTLEAGDPATEALACVGCGVLHGDACPACRGRGFHRDGCAELDA